jgi:hypothetical protein
MGEKNGRTSSEYWNLVRGSDGETISPEKKLSWNDLKVNDHLEDK